MNLAERDYDNWKTNPDYDYAGRRRYRTEEEEYLFSELNDLQEQEAILEDNLDEIRHEIRILEEKLGLF